METTEAFILRKFDYGEADYIVSAFTRDFGKIRGLAKNAKKSRRRFGGRLEPFVHSRIRFREKTGGLKFIEDAETVRVFSNLMEDADLFIWGSFVLENIDVTLPEEETNNNIFELLVSTLSSLNSTRNPIPLILNFQISLLSSSGYQPNFDNCLECGRPFEEGIFSMMRGGVCCGQCQNDRSNGFYISKKNLLNQDPLGENSAAALQFIRLLYRFTEYHTGKEIKSSKFIEELKQ